MRSRIRELLAEAENQDAAEKAHSALALYRIILQHLCIGLAEWVISEFRRSKVEEETVPPDLTPLLRPTDGTLLDVLQDLAVLGQNLGWEGLSRPLWRPIPVRRPALQLAETKGPNLEDVLRGLIARRNDSVQGHGLPGREKVDAWLDAVRLLFESYQEVLPVVDATDGSLELRPPGAERLRLRLLRTVQGNLVCYRYIRPVGGDRCVVHGQRQVSLTEREDSITWEAEHLLGYRLGGPATFVPLPTFERDWSPIGSLPSPMTRKFLGREKELGELAEWFDDTGSRACLVFGDGGIGKTTLVLEFLNRVLSGATMVRWRPELLVYFTAKRTRWGLEGLEQIGAGNPSLHDFASDVHRRLQGEPAPRTWLKRDERAVVASLSQLLSEWGLSPGQTLVVLDNTETLSQTVQDVNELALAIRDLSRHVGRVLLTSRRREAIEAWPLEVPPLSDDEAVALLRSRAAELNRESILQAGDARLRSIARDLGSRPLVLEVFVQVLRDPNLGLKRALERVQGMQRKDLGEFLYLDAWRRLTPELRGLLLLMTRSGEVHEEALFRLCCQTAGLSALSALEALEESRGIVSTVVTSGNRELVFNLDFVRFAEARPREDWTLKGMTLEQAVGQVRKRYRQLIKSRGAHVYDRVSRAFRTPFARAAWQAFQEQRWEDCERNYELAVVEDKTNGLLFDRYAYFLFRQERLDDALGRSREATRLSPGDAETWFTRGLIEARLGLADEATSSLTRAEALGKPAHLCHLQIAYGLMKARPARPFDAMAELVRAKEMPEGEELGEHLVRKHFREIGDLERRIFYLVKRG